MYSNKKFLLLIGGTFVIIGIVGFKLIPANLSFLAPTSYFALTIGLETYNSVIILILCLIGFGIFLYVLSRIFERKPKGKTLYFSKPLMVYIMISLFGIIYTAYTVADAEMSVWDIWAIIHAGADPNYASYIPFFFYIIVYFGFIYLYQIFLSTEIDMMGYYKILRFKSLNKWFFSWYKKMLLVIVVFLLLHLITPTVTASIFGARVEFQLTMFSFSLSEVIFHYFFNGFLQIIFYSLVVFMISWLSKESIHGVLILCLFIVLLLPGINLSGLIPVGLNSLSFLEYHSASFLTVVLMLANIVLFAFIQLLFRKSLKL